MSLIKILQTIKLPILVAVVLVVVGNIIYLNPDLELLASIVLAIPAFVLTFYSGYLIVKEGRMKPISAGIGGIIIYLFILATRLVTVFLIFPSILDYFASSSLAVIGVALIVAFGTIAIDGAISFFIGYVGGKLALKTEKGTKPPQK